MNVAQLLEWFNNEVLWKYFAIPLLLFCALYFTIRSRGVQFRMFGEMFRVLSRSQDRVDEGHRHISSFQVFMVSLAGRVGTGNLAGVGVAIAIGGPGSMFWMWLIATLGAASALIESTLAQLYKRRGKDSFYGGPAYYIKHGLGKGWLAVAFSVVIIITFGLGFNSVQSNTICEAFDGAFGANNVWIGIVLTVLTLLIIFGGIQRIAKVSSIVVPIMALGYILLALVVVAININRLPEAFAMIFRSAFGLEQALGGGIGAALMLGVRRGLFSNEAGIGSAPNVAATASVSHPVKQGLIQSLGVFTDTLLICSCTAMIILTSGVYTPESTLSGIQLTQTALSATIGNAGHIFIALAILLFAFTSIIGNYYYGETNIRYLTDKRWVMTLYRLASGAMVLFGALTTMDTVWAIADITMGLLALINLSAILMLSRQALFLLNNYTRQKRSGSKDPQFDYSMIDPKVIDPDKIECWD